ncbi:MAG: L-sorbosone dehydrogenase, partial [Thermomicrobiales bacterium]|nr:L-sorbosone dehydrogenase [Thermomicrobiales bacterium]
VSGLLRPSSVAFFTADDGPYLYVGETHQVTRFAYDPAGPAGDPEVVIPGLPTEGAHWTRTVAFGPDGMLYLSVGSSCNICLEAEPVRAAISRANPDGSDFEIIATGLRNAVGMTFAPDTGELWATVNERDMQGNEIPPDLVTIVLEGASYGWPGCVPPDATPQVPQADCSGITPPTIGIQAHSAPAVTSSSPSTDLGIGSRRPCRSYCASTSRTASPWARSISRPAGRTRLGSAGAGRQGWGWRRTGVSSFPTTATG